MTVYASDLAVRELAEGMGADQRGQNTRLDALDLKSVTDSFGSFGAVGDGVADDSNAVEAALRSGHTIKNETGRRFRITRSIYVPDVSVNWRGGVIVAELSLPGPALRFTRTATNTGTFCVDVDDVSVLTTNSLATHGILFDYDPALPASPVTILGNDRHFKTIRLGGGVDVGPYDNTNPAHVFATCVEVQSWGRPDLEGLMVRGPKPTDSTWAAGSVGIKFSGEGSPVLQEVKGVQFRHLETGIQVTHNFEGLAIRGVSMEAVMRGVVIDPPGLGYECVGIFVQQSHINAAECCVSISNGAEIYINACELYQYRNVSASWVGVELGNAASRAVRSFHISGNDFSATAGMTNRRPVVLGNCDRGWVHDNFGHQLDTGVEINDTYYGTVKKYVFVKDNHWEGDSAANLTAANKPSGLTAQTTNNRRVFAAYSYLHNDYGAATVAELQAIANPDAGSTAYCTNESGGAVSVFRGPTAWLRVTDRAVIS